MKELQKKAIEIFKDKGTVSVIDCYGCTKVLRSEKDVKACFKLAISGAIDELVEIK